MSISVAEVAAETGLTKRQVLRLTRKGLIPAAIIGRRFSMTQDQFERLKREGVMPESRSDEKATKVKPTPIRDPEPSDFLKKRSA